MSIWFIQYFLLCQLKFRTQYDQYLYQVFMKFGALYDKPHDKLKQRLRNLINQSFILYYNSLIMQMST